MTTGIDARFARRIDRAVPGSAPLFVARLGATAVFFQSGRTKVEGFLTITDGTLELFRTEYALPLIQPELAAYAATYSEHLFPILLLLGLFTRPAALATDAFVVGRPALALDRTRRWRLVAG